MEFSCPKATKHFLSSEEKIHKVHHFLFYFQSLELNSTQALAVRDVNDGTLWKILTERLKSLIISRSMLIDVSNLQCLWSTIRKHLIIHALDKNQAFYTLKASSTSVEVSHWVPTRGNLKLNLPLNDLCSVWKKRLDTLFSLSLFHLFSFSSLKCSAESKNHGSA